MQPVIFQGGSFAQYSIGLCSIGMVVSFGLAVYVVEMEAFAKLEEKSPLTTPAGEAPPAPLSTPGARKRRIGVFLILLALIGVVLFGATKAYVGSPSRPAASRQPPTHYPNFIHNRYTRTLAHSHTRTLAHSHTRTLAHSHTLTLAHSHTRTLTTAFPLELR